MTPNAPKIGFDRYIALEWVTAALDVRTGQASLDEFDAVLDSASFGAAARKKTRTVLNRLWLDPRPELVDFADRGAALHRLHPEVGVPVLAWGMAIATYPFFGKVAELVGRLTALQGDCSSAEIHRRMSEVYGEREGTYRMTNMVLQSQASWGVVERVEKGKRLVRRPAAVINNDGMVAWLLEAALRYSGKAIPVASIQSLPILFPFFLDRPPAYVASNSHMLDIRSEGSNLHFVVMRDAG